MGLDQKLDKIQMAMEQELGQTSLCSTSGRCKVENKKLRGIVPLFLQGNPLVIKVSILTSNLKSKEFLVLCLEVAHEKRTKTRCA